MHLKNVTRYIKLLAVEILTASVIFMLSVSVFAFVTNEVVLENENGADIKIYNFFTAHISLVNTSTALFFSFFGSGWFLIPVYLSAIFYCIKKGKQQYAVLVASAGLTSICSGLLIKFIFKRARPLLPLVTGTWGYSFPSGHSISGFTLSALAVYFIWQPALHPYIKWLLSAASLTLGICIGLSRIYLRVHYASDVLGGFLITSAWLSLLFIFKGFVQKNS